MVDFNTVYQAISPYLGTSSIATALILIAILALKVLKLGKEAKIIFSNTYAQSIEAFKKAIPKDLYISIEALAKSELSKIKTELSTAINENWLQQISVITELVKAIAVALISMKSIPDSSKEQIAKLLSIEAVETTEKLKVELIQVEESSAAVTMEKPLID